MHNSDELLDADAAAANRRDVRHTVVVTAISLAIVLAASLIMIVGGISA